MIGDFIFRLLHVLAHQTAEHDRLAVPDAHVRGHLARAENRLVNHVAGEKNLGRSTDTPVMDHREY